MKKNAWSKFKRYGSIVLIVILAYTSIKTLLIEPVSKNNTKMINGHYRSIEKQVLEGRGGGSVSYNLYLDENNEYYKIGASGSDCFYYYSFKSVIKEKALVSIYVCDSIFFIRPVVVCVIVNGVEYLSFNCINDTITQIKTFIPLICLGIIIMIMVSYFKNQIMAQLKKF